MNEHVPFPRPDPDREPESANLSRRILGGIFVFCGFGGCCLFSAPLMIAEGPHGPNGEITSDPSAPRLILLVVLVSLAIVVGGIMLYRSGKK